MLRVSSTVTNVTAGTDDGSGRRLGSGLWRHALFDLPSELVTQVDGAVSGYLTDASHRRDILPGELGVGWRDSALEEAAHGHFELAPIVQRHGHG